MNEKTHKFIKILSAAMAALMLCACLVGCAARPLSPSDEALKEVGTVDGYSVPYEEFYFLAKNYDSDKLTSDELFAIVSENIVSNYAILSLCRDAGVEYDEDELEDDVDKRMEEIIDTDFGGKRKNYLEALEESGMTDHYVRFTVRTDLLYSKLTTALATKGEIAASDADIAAYIESNFIRTWHIMIAEGEGAKEQAQEALDKLRTGKATMYDLIGSSINDDLLIPGDGYVFTRGSMEKEYEDAAYSLKVNTYSEVISAKGELGTGEYVDCYYVIQRLPLDKEYIDAHFGTLRENYEDSIVAAKLEQRKSELEFVPNDYAKSLDVKNLSAPFAGTDTYLIAVLSVSGVCAAGIIVAAVFIIRHLSKKKKAQLAEKKKRALKAKD